MDASQEAPLSLSTAAVAARRAMLARRAFEEGERRGTGADARAAEKRAAAGLKLQVVVSVWVGHGQFLERVSSRLRSMFETSVQAASSSAGIFSGAFDSPNATSRLAASESAA